ncbi:hypothetical protein [Halogeometricum sp. CBA1124]|uniref:hypothetical protein n=1 Tax=Halogeometricum sp. CBA1124 TaxID=2668071 RepID=UPI00142CAF08|nr:hypothetical protein [Halogeometricum sp. CBA1124]MUV56236.1 hypothetical protein [Halogeometricum sp. CBA1124]
MPFEKGERYTVRRVLREMESMGWLARESPRAATWRMGEQAKLHLNVSSDLIRESWRGRTMDTGLASLEEYWQEVGVKGVRPALGGPESLVNRFEEYVREGLLNVYRYEIDKRRAQRREIERLEHEIKSAEWDNTGSSTHQHMMAVVCWHVAEDLGRDYVVGREYQASGQYFDVADSRCLLPFEVGTYGENVKLETLFQAGAFRRTFKYDKPEPNGIGRVAFVPYPDVKSTAKKPDTTFPVFVFTKEWMTEL